MSLTPAYINISLFSDKNGGLKHASNIYLLYLLLDIFSITEINSKIAQNKCCDVWDMAKQYHFVASDVDSLRAIYNAYNMNYDRSNGDEFTNSTPLVTLFQNLMGYVSPEIRAKINSHKQFQAQLDMLRQQFIPNPRYNTHIILSKNNHLSREESVNKLLDTLNNAELREQVNREQLDADKNTIIWNYTKFNYSHAVKHGLVLNDDVISVIKSFISTETRMDHLRLRYTDKWLTEELMKKNKKQLLMIINHINKQQFLTRSINKRHWLYGTLFWDNMITLNGNKDEQVLKIVNAFSKIEKISKGGSYMVKISNKNVSKVLKKERLPEYKNETFKLFQLLVSIAKNPSKQKQKRLVSK